MLTIRLFQGALASAALTLACHAGAATVATLDAGVLTIGSDLNITNFESQVTSARLVPNVDTEDAINVLSGEQVAGDRSESFTLEGSLLQDFGATGSTTEWLYNHRGEEHAFSFTPSTAAGKKITGNLVVEAIEIGGDARTKPTSDFEFVVVGAPTIVSIP